MILCVGVPKIIYYQLFFIIIMIFCAFSMQAIPPAELKNKVLSTK